MVATSAQSIDPHSTVSRSRSRKGTITSKIGKLFGVAKIQTDVESIDTKVKSSSDQASPSCSSSSSSSSTSLGSRYPYDGTRSSSPRLSNPSSRIPSSDKLASATHSAAASVSPVSAAATNSSTAVHIHNTNVIGASNNAGRRFVALEDGSHEHHLKNAKRQEKLGSMIKNMLGAQRLRGEAKSAVPEILIKSMKSGDPPSLFSGLINQVNIVAGADLNAPFPYSGATQVPGQKPASTQGSADANNDRMKDFENAINPLHQNSLSFAEKYGRCQEVIGKGSFGVVRICHKKNLKNANGEILYAVKEFRRKPTEDPAKYSKRLTSEFCISSSLKHTNIIDTLDLFQDAKGDYCEVMEYCSGGDLFTLIIAAGKLEYQEADCFFKQLITGVVYMHEMGVCHRDLKPENLLLTHDGTLKITDFGNSECFRMAWEKEIHLSGGVCGSSPYIAPEEYTHDEFDARAVDIWACGVIYMAMRTGRQLWATAQKEDEFYMKYLTGRKDEAGYDPIEQLKRARCRNVIYSILDPVPSRRLNGDQILNSEWGREIKCCHKGHPVK